MQNDYLFQALVQVGAEQELARQAANCEHCMEDIRNHLFRIHQQAASMNSEICLLKQDVVEINKRLDRLEAGQAKLEEGQAKLASMIQQLLDRQ